MEARKKYVGKSTALHAALLRLVFSRTVVAPLLTITKNSGTLNPVGKSVHSQLRSYRTPLLDWSLEGS